MHTKPLITLHIILPQPFPKRVILSAARTLAKLDPAINSLGRCIKTNYDHYPSVPRAAGLKHHNWLPTVIRSSDVMSKTSLEDTWGWTIRHLRQVTDMFSVQFAVAAITGTTRRIIYFSSLRLGPDMSVSPGTGHCHSSSLKRRVVKSPDVSCVASGVWVERKICKVYNQEIQRAEQT